MVEPPKPFSPPPVGSWVRHPKHGVFRIINTLENRGLVTGPGAPWVPTRECTPLQWHRTIRLLAFLKVAVYYLAMFALAMIPVGLSIYCEGILPVLLYIPAGLVAAPILDYREARKNRAKQAPETF